MPTVTMVAHFSQELKWTKDNRMAAAVIYCGALSALGLCISSLGPVLIELAAQTSSTIGEAAYCSIVRSIGYLVGCLMGPIFDRVKGNNALAFGVFFAGIGSFGVTGAMSLGVLGLMLSFQGFASRQHGAPAWEPSTATSRPPFPLPPSLRALQWACLTRAATSC